MTLRWNLRLIPDTVVCTVSGDLWWHALRSEETGEISAVKWIPESVPSLMETQLLQNQSSSLVAQNEPKSMRV